MSSVPRCHIQTAASFHHIFTAVSTQENLRFLDKKYWKNMNVLFKENKTNKVEGMCVEPKQE